MKTKIKIAAFLVIYFASQYSYAQFTDLQNWIALDYLSRSELPTTYFAKQVLTQNEAQKIIGLLQADHICKMQSEYTQQWENHLLSKDGYNMPFYYQIFGAQPIDGRSLYISLHGGGDSTAAYNDKEYYNQQHFFDASMSEFGGVYLAPRAAKDTSSLWNQKYVDDFLNIIIQMAFIHLNVNPNKIYLLGYSAGGDGVYQLAPRMADRWAAASMMSGQPNNASPMNLRNTPFTIHVGAMDKTNNRNLKAKQWGFAMDSLQVNDPQGYVHEVTLHAGLGHWLNRQYLVAFPWMTAFKRNPIPNRVVWLQSEIHQGQFNWLATPSSNIVSGGLIVAEYDSLANEIRIEHNYSDTIQLLINDKMLDLNSPVTIKYQSTVIYQGMLHRSIQNIYESIASRGDSNLIFPCVVEVYNNKTVAEPYVDLKLSVPRDSALTSKKEIKPKSKSNNFIHLSLASPLRSTAVIKFEDMLGKELLSMETIKEENRIDLSDFDSGVYFISVQYDNEKITFKYTKH